MQKNLCITDKDHKRLIKLYKYLKRKFPKSDILCDRLDVTKENQIKKKIICISSVSGTYVSAAPTTYAIAKAALNNFVRHASKLLTKENIVLNCVAPGNIYFKGGVWDKNLRKNKSYYKKYINSEVPEKRLGTPEEVAELVGYLCSDSSTFINGSVISIDGGQNKSL